MSLSLTLLVLTLVTMATGQLCERHWRRPCGDKRNSDTRVQYQIQNNLPEAGPIFSAGQIVYVTSGNTTFDMMQLAEGCNNQMALNYTLHPEFGASIQGLNQVYADHDKEIFWAFMKKDRSGLCLMNVGVSTYQPVRGDRIVHSMEKYSIFDELPNCSGSDTPHD